MVFTVLLWYLLYVTEAHIFYGNEMLSYTTFGITSFEHEYNGREALRIYSWSNHKEAAGIQFLKPSSYSYKLSISVQITARDVANNGNCRIKFNENEHDILLKPDTAECRDTIGGLIYDDYNTGCNDLINKQEYIDNIVFINHESDNSSAIYIESNLIHEIPYNVESSFGFVCENAVGFISGFTFIIDNDNKQEIFPIDNYNPSPISSSTTAIIIKEDVDINNDDEKRLNTFYWILVVIGGIIIMAAICTLYMRVKTKKADYSTNMKHIAVVVDGISSETAETKLSADV